MAWKTAKTELNRETNIPMMEYMKDEMALVTEGIDACVGNLVWTIYRLTPGNVIAHSTSSFTAGRIISN
jgi:hypothetical protein